MPRIRPFAGLLYDQVHAGPLDRLTAPPYDVITGPERARLHRRSPYNVVRLIWGLDLPGDDDRSNRYTRAAEALAEWRRTGVLVPTAPAVFPYVFDFQDEGRSRRVRALVASVDLAPLGRGAIGHERTMPGPLRDRMSLIRAVAANLSPVHIVYRAGDASMGAPARDLMEDSLRAAPLADTTDEQGTRHRLWAQPDAAAVCDRLSRVELMIADGHHRYAAALAYRDEMRAAVGPGPWDAMMALLVDAESEDPPILPIHRVLRMPAARSSGEATPAARHDDHAADRAAVPAALVGDIATLPDLAAMRARGTPVRDLEEVVRSLSDDPPVAGLVTMDEDELMHRLLPLTGDSPAVRALHRGPLRNTDHRQLSYAVDAVDAEAMVRSGRAAAALLLPATHIAAVERAIAAGERLPEKSTYFWPKPRTGMVIRPLMP